MAPDIININITTGDGLSQAIDRKLDEELKQDVRFNLSEWNSVFNVIKEDKATAKKQYSGGDSDITDSRQYVVQEGNYKITQNAWNKIVDIAKKKLGITSQKIQEVKQETEPEEKIEAAAGDEKIKTMLSDAGINANETDMAKIKSKYEMILAYNTKNGIKTDEAKLKERIINFAKGLQYHNAETQFALNNGGEAIVIDGVKEAVQNGDMEAFKAAFHQKAKEYIELYDNTEGDGKISIDELVAMEEKELGRALTAKEKNIVEENAINMISVLNQDNDPATLDENEIAAYLWTMSKINDGNDKKTADDITFEEWNTSRESLGILSGTTLTDEQLDIINPAFSIINKTGKSLEELYELEDLSSLDITDEEKNILSNALPLLFDNGFNQEMIDNYAKFTQALRNGYEGLKE